MSAIEDPVMYTQEDALFHDSGRRCAYAIQIIVNFTIVALMSANIQFITKFQKLTYTMVFSSLFLVILGFIADIYDSWLLEGFFFKIIKFLFIAFNYGICYQLNESLNHSTCLINTVLALILVGILFPLLFNGSWKGTYIANIVLCVYALKLLYEIKQKSSVK